MQLSLTFMMWSGKKIKNFLETCLNLNVKKNKNKTNEI